MTCIWIGIYSAIICLLYLILIILPRGFGLPSLYIDTLIPIPSSTFSSSNIEGKVKLSDILPTDTFSTISSSSSSSSSSSLSSSSNSSGMILSWKWNLHSLFIYLCLILSSFGHSFAYYYLLSYVGAVSTGILQALRAISVFILSAYYFCSVDLSQCFTMWKGLSTLLVVSGVIGFSFATTFKKSSPSIATSTSTSTPNSTTSVSISSQHQSHQLGGNSSTITGDSGKLGIRGNEENIALIGRSMNRKESDD